MTAFLLMWFWLAFIGTLVMFLIYGFHPILALLPISLGWVIGSVVYMYRWFRHPVKS